MARKTKPLVEVAARTEEGRVPLGIMNTKQALDLPEGRPLSSRSLRLFVRFGADRRGLIHTQASSPRESPAY